MQLLENLENCAYKMVDTEKTFKFSTKCNGYAYTLLGGF